MLKGAFFALFVCGGATQKPEFQPPRLEKKRETSSPSQKGQKKTQHHPAVSYKKKFILVSNELSSSPPSPHKIKGKRHASSPSNDDDDVDSRDLQMLLLLCVVVGVGVLSVFFED